MPYKALSECSIYKALQSNKVFTKNPIVTLQPYKVFSKNPIVTLQPYKVFTRNPIVTLQPYKVFTKNPIVTLQPYKVFAQNPIVTLQPYKAYGLWPLNALIRHCLIRISENQCLIETVECLYITYNIYILPSDIYTYHIYTKYI